MCLKNSSFVDDPGLLGNYTKRPRNGEDNDTEESSNSKGIKLSKSPVSSANVKSVVEQFELNKAN